MRRRYPRVPIGLFSSEEELCARFMPLAREAGFRVYPETSNWDILLVEPSTGRQIGIQAKLRPNLDVLAQALPFAGTHMRSDGPDVRAVLIPSTPQAFHVVALHLNLHVYAGALVTSDAIRTTFDHAHVWEFKKREWVPEVEIDMPAGTAGPQRITPWKMAAVTICLRVLDKGYVSPADFRELRINQAWWFQYQFGPVFRVASRGRYEFNPDQTAARWRPDLRWPEITRAIRAKELQPKSVRPRGRVRISTGPNRLAL